MYVCSSYCLLVLYGNGDDLTYRNGMESMQCIQCISSSKGMNDLMVSYRYNADVLLRSRAFGTYSSTASDGSTTGIARLCS